MKRDGETGSIKRVAGVPHPEGAADSEAHREDPTKTDEHAGADPAAGIKHVDPMVLWGTWPGDEPIEELLAMLDGRAPPVPPGVADIGKSHILPPMKTVISTKGQFVLPAELRRRDRVAPGEEFEIERLGPGVYRLARTGVPTNLGLVDLLLACPEKGWFVPVPSESTADLDGPGFEEPHDQIPR